MFTRGQTIVNDFLKKAEDSLVRAEFTLETIAAAGKHIDEVRKAGALTGRPTARRASDSMQSGPIPGTSRANWPR